PEKKPPEEPAAEPQPAAPAAPQEWFSLGSIDPKSGHRILVTLNNRGAAVERIELASHDYIDLEDATGYLGHLALTSTEKGGGGRVTVAGPGPPAAQATPEDTTVKPGLVVGDVIRSLNGTPVAGTDEFKELLKDTKPGQTVEIEVTREVSGTPTKLVFTVDL